MKNKQELDQTTNSTVFKKAARRYNLKCNRCPPHRGCNRWCKIRRHESWKKYRQKQYRVRYIR